MSEQMGVIQTETYPQRFEVLVNITSILESPALQLLHFKLQWDLFHYLDWAPTPGRFTTNSWCKGMLEARS